MCATKIRFCCSEIFKYCLTQALSAPHIPLMQETKMAGSLVKQVSEAYVGNAH